MDTSRSSPVNKKQISPKHATDASSMCVIPAFPCCFFPLQNLDTRHRVAMVKVKNIFAQVIFLESLLLFLLHLFCCAAFPAFFFFLVFRAHYYYFAFHLLGHIPRRGGKKGRRQFTNFPHKSYRQFANGFQTAQTKASSICCTFFLSIFCSVSLGVSKNNNLRAQCIKWGLNRRIKVTRMKRQAVQWFWINFRVDQKNVNFQNSGRYNSTNKGFHFLKNDV